MSWEYRRKRAAAQVFDEKNYVTTTKNCNFCGKEFTHHEPRREYYTPRAPDDCLECRRFLRYLHNCDGEIEQEYRDRFHPGFLLLIIYNISGDEHSGYCSDPGKPEHFSDEDHAYFPLVKEIDLDEFDDDDLISCDHPMIVKYYSLENRRSRSCGCYDTPVFRLLRAQLISE